MGAYSHSLAPCAMLRMAATSWKTCPARCQSTSPARSAPLATSQVSVAATGLLPFYSLLCSCWHHAMGR